MENNKSLWNLLKNSATIVEAFASAVSVIITYLLLPPEYRWTLPPIGAVVLIVGVVVAALRVIKQNRNQTDEQIGERDRKIARLEEEIKRLKIKPCDVPLENVKGKLQEFDDDGRKVLKALCIWGPVQGIQLTVAGVGDNKKYWVLEKGEKNGLITRTKENSLDIKKQFKPVLKDLLFQPQDQGMAKNVIQ